MLKVGLIGCGGIGSVHANCYAALSDSVSLVAVADLDRAKAAKAACISGGTIYNSASELLAADLELDIVDICLPTYLHTQYAVEAMEKGCNVFVEKPVCLTMDEASLLLDAQKRTGMNVQVGQVMRFWDEYTWLKDTVDEGKYGKIISAVFSRLSAVPKWSWENWYDDYTKSGTAALDLHIHDVDFVRYLMGAEPREITAQASRNSEGVIQQIFAQYIYDGAVITSEGCWDYPDNYPFGMTYRVKMEHATAVFDGEQLTVYMKDGTRIRPELTKNFNVDVDSVINISGIRPYYNEIKYFTDCIASGTAPVIAPLHEACRSIELALKEIEKSGGAKK